MQTVLLINGPNLNLLGVREPEIYGTQKLRDIVSMVRNAAAARHIRIKHYQSNHEGRIIDRIHSTIGRGYLGIIINPGALTPYSYALRDAIKSCGIATIEVHLSAINAREEFRRTSVTKDVCIAQIQGLGPEGYVRALYLLIDRQNARPESQAT